MRPGGSYNGDLLICSLLKFHLPHGCSIQPLRLRRVHVGRSRRYDQRCVGPGLPWGIHFQCV